MSIETTINYYQGLYGVIFFDWYSSDTAYIHENDMNPRPEYLKQILGVINAELREVKNFKDLYPKVKEALYDMEDTTAEDYL